MAGLSWFELDIDFHQHQKTVALQVELRNPTAEAYVSRIWAYCYHHALDRFVGPAAVATIEGAAAWKGKPGRLVAALLMVGFLEHSGDALVAHGVKERLGPHLKAKAAAAARQRVRRDKLAQSPASDGHVTRDEARDEASDVTRDVPRMSSVYRDRDRDSTEITNVTDPSPASASLPRAARLGVGHPAYVAIQHWTGTVWPGLSPAPCEPVTQRLAQALADLCQRHTPAEVMARMDRAAADPFWRGKLDLETVVAKWDRFAPRTSAPTPAAARGIQPVGSNWEAKL